MSKKLEELYEDLEKYKNFDDGDNAEKFLDTVDSIALIKDWRCISKLISYFNDNDEYDWIQYSLLHTIESFPDDIYVHEVLRNLDTLFECSKNWTVDIIKRMINNANCLGELRPSMHLAPKESLLKLFDLMEKESPHHSEIIKELREEVAKLST